MKTLVIGLGNPILGDDGIGWIVAGRVGALLAENQPELNASRSIEVDCAALGGLSLMERLTGFERVVIIDAMSTGRQPIGTVNHLMLGDLADLSAGHTTAVHDTSLRNALNVGRSMNIPLPQDENIHVVAIEAEVIQEFSETLSTPVEAAIPAAVETVVQILGQE